MRLIRPSLVMIALLLLCGSAWAQEAKPQPDSAIEAQLKALDYKFEIDKDGDYKLVFDMDEDGKRSQLVFVRSGVEDYLGHKVREVISPAYEGNEAGFPANVANRLLAASTDSIMGAWGKQGGLAIYTVRIPANADKDTLDAAINAAINSADKMEAELTPGKDEF